MPWVLAIVAACWGLFGGDFGRFVLFGALGWLLGRQLERGTGGDVGDRLDALERENVTLKQRLNVLEFGSSTAAPSAPTAPPPVERPRPMPEVTPDFALGRPPAAAVRPPKAPLPPPKPPETPAPPPPAPNPVVAAVVRFFTSGNVFGKVGAILLFFGVALLIKFVSDMRLFPIEGRHTEPGSRVTRSYFVPRLPGKVYASPFPVGSTLHEIPKTPGSIPSRPMSCSRSACCFPAASSFAVTRVLPGSSISSLSMALRVSGPMLTA